MLKKWALLLVVVCLALSLGTLAACGDDDDDDDDDTVNTPCESYFILCAYQTHEEATDSCASYDEFDDECFLDAAVDLFACIGTDCDNFEDCAAQYEDDGLECAEDA